ncbi:MAG: hypothetical protein SFW36_22640 [Leptolyngbyaceae cyanobacterium bins.59]|nr:hypothetical protein [Leptolyngbyaceae cyanobacterium bins.59]
MKLRSLQRTGFVLLLVLSLVMTLASQAQPQSASPREGSAAPALVSVTDAWQQVYRQLPNFPRENQYVNQTTGQPVPGNTLIGRMIRYHVYLKGRPPNYRLDWKLTLADYLGINEPMEDTRYPGSEVLQVNPIDGDRAVINKLNRAQREQLVQALVGVFTRPIDGSAPQAPTSVPVAPARPANPSAPSGLPPRPKPGDAQLLAP